MLLVDGGFLVMADGGLLLVDGGLLLVDDGFLLLVDDGWLLLVDGGYFLLVDDGLLLVDVERLVVKGGILWVKNGELLSQVSVVKATSATDYHTGTHVGVILFGLLRLGIILIYRKFIIIKKNFFFITQMR